MILPIYIYGQEVLRKKCTDIDNSYPNLQKLIGDMFETLSAADGVGLSAPQVGFDIRLFICNVEDWADDLGDNIPEGDPYRRVFINPTVIELTGQKDIFREGCLSLPGINENVSRPTVVKIRYWDENWVEHTHTFDKSWARVIQHEYDHIEGKLFSDHLAPIRKNMIKSKLLGLTRGNYKAKYRCK